MREELDKALCEKYPDIFKNRYASPQESCMAWGFDCGDGWYTLIDNLCAVIRNHEENIERNRDFNLRYAKMREAALEGDWSLFNQHYLVFSKNIESNKYAEWIQNQKEQLLGEIPVWLRNDEPVEHVVALQVKEKFGGLSFYYYGGDEFVTGAVTLAGKMSYTICEECGSPGRVRSGGWIRTLCEEHAKEYYKE